MNLYYQALTHLPLGRAPARRNDLLALGTAIVKVLPGYHETLARLSGLGFTVTRPGAGHWVLVKAGESFQVHLYSEQELATFARDRAALYACGFVLAVGDNP